jgi:hypothetical protein
MLGTPSQSLLKRRLLQGAGDFEPALHAAREALDVVVAPLPQPNEAQQRLDPRAALCPRHAGRSSERSGSCGNTYPMSLACAATCRSSVCVWASPPAIWWSGRSARRKPGLLL